MCEAKYHTFWGLHKGTIEKYFLVEKAYLLEDEEHQKSYEQITGYADLITTADGVETFILKKECKYLGGSEILEDWMMDEKGIAKTSPHFYSGRPGYLDITKFSGEKLDYRRTIWIGNMEKEIRFELQLDRKKYRRSRLFYFVG